MKLMLFSIDLYFLNQITDYISRTQKDIQLITYSDIAKAHEYLQKNSFQIDAVLADKVFFDGQAVSAKIKIICGGYTGLTAENDYYHLNIYQQRENLIRDLRKICLEQGSYNTEIRQETASKIIAFFSVQGGSGQSTIIYQCAARLSQEYKVLYLPFDLINTYQLLYTSEYPVGIDELMFQIKDKTSDQSSFYRAIVRNQHGIYILPPFQTIGDLIELTEEDGAFLLRQIQDLNEFDFIFLDLPKEINPLNRQLMKMSEKVISVYTDDIIGQTKQQCFQQDPYIDQMDWAHKITVVFSKSTQENKPGNETVYFPYVPVRTDLFQTFYQHGRFKESCEALKERIL